MPIEIRASMGDSYLDCPRRAAAKQWGKGIIKEAGFVLAKTEPSVGSLIGNAVHAALAKLLQYKKDNGLRLDYREVLPEIKDDFVKEFAKGCLTDDTTNNRFVGLAQIDDMVREADRSFIATAEPVLIETQFYADAGDGFELGGRLDTYLDDFSNWDHKSSAHLDKSYQVQQGFYGILLRTHDYPVKRLGINGLQRVTAKKPIPDLIQWEYPVGESERLAYDTLDRMKADYKRFEDTHDPRAFQPRPSSMNCSNKFCPIWNTPMCTHGKGVVTPIQKEITE